MRIDPRQGMYDLAMRPVAWVRRRVFWPMRSLHWWDWIDEWVLVGGRILEEDIGPLSRAGIGAVMNLCAEVHDPLRAIRAAGMRALHLPTDDMAAPTPEAIARAIRFIDSNVRREARTYVHCAHGIGRSPTLAAAWLVHRGWAPEDALLVVKARRPVASLRSAQVRAVLEFAKRVAGDAARLGARRMLLDSPGGFVQEGGIA